MANPYTKWLLTNFKPVQIGAVGVKTVVKGTAGKELRAGGGVGDEVVAGEVATVESADDMLVCRSFFSGWSSYW